MRAIYIDVVNETIKEIEVITGERKELMEILRAKYAIMHDAPKPCMPPDHVMVKDQLINFLHGPERIKGSCALEYSLKTVHFNDILIIGFINGAYTDCTLTVEEVARNVRFLPEEERTRCYVVAKRFKTGWSTPGSPYN